MHLSELRNRLRLPLGAAAFRGDECLIPDIRGGLRPVDCIDRKLNKLLAEDSSNRAGRSPHGSGACDAAAIAPTQRCSSTGDERRHGPSFLARRQN